jgi:hypothetical protein
MNAPIFLSLDVRAAALAFAGVPKNVPNQTKA